MLCRKGHKTGKNSLLCFHSMHDKAASSEAVCEYPICCMEGDCNLLCLEIEGRDYLAIGCSKCGINLFDLNGENQTFIKAFPDSRVLAICEGEENTLYVRDGSCIVELDCSTTNFKRKRSLYNGRVILLSSLCYIPFQHPLIVCADRDVTQTFFAISCESGEPLWDVPVKEHLLFRYLPEQKGLLVFCKQFGASKLSVYCPETGKCTQKIPLPCAMAVEDMLVSKGSLFILGPRVVDECDRIVYDENETSSIVCTRDDESVDSENETISCFVFQVK